MGPDTPPSAKDLFQQRRKQMLREKAHECVWNTSICSSQSAPPHPWKAQHASEMKVPAGETCFLLFNLSAFFDHGILFPQNTYELAEYRFPGAWCRDCCRKPGWRFPCPPPWLLHHPLMAWSRMENASLGKGGAVEPEMLTVIVCKAGSQLSELMKNWEVINVSSPPWRQLKNQSQGEEARGRCSSGRLKPAPPLCVNPSCWGLQAAWQKGGAALTHRLFQKPDVCIKSPTQHSWGEEYRTAEGWINPGRSFGRGNA